VRCEGDDVRTRWRGILNGPSAGIDGGGGDSGVARSDTLSAAREVRRAAGLSGWHCQNTDMGDGTVGMRAAVGTDNGMLTGGLSVERERLTGGSYMSVSSELKFTPGRK
jgi:hypothetical protein